MGYIGSGPTRFNTADDLTVTDDAEIKGGLTVDTTTLVVDEANNRVGIGTISPLAPLDVKLATDIHVGIDDSGSDAVIFSSTDIGQTAVVPLKFQANSFKFNGSSEFMRIDSSGRVTMPYQPAFLASLSSNVTGTTYVNYLTFGATEYNVGNHYSTSTGRFTAPISGLYQFILKLNVITNTFAEVKIYKNGSEIIRCYNPTGGNSYIRTGWVIGAVNLSSGDYVQGVFYDGSAGSGTVQGGGDINNASSTLQGYLIG